MFNVASKAAILKCNTSQETKSSTFHGPGLGIVRKVQRRNYVALGNAWPHIL